MKEITEKYYISSDGKRFEDESECKEYEDAWLKIKNLKSQILALSKELARAEYIFHYKGKYIESAKYAGGNGHDGYYSKCPHCEELIGGYEGSNTSLKVDNNVYRCEKCGTFFVYS
jgi:hypothetical protein